MRRRRKRDANGRLTSSMYVGRYVRLLREARNRGGRVFRVGEIMLVTSWWRAGLALKAVDGEEIRFIPKRDVEVSEDKKIEPGEVSVAKCQKCGILTTLHLPRGPWGAEGDGSLFYPRRHKMQGRPCDGNRLEAILFDVPRGTRIYGGVAT